MGNEFDFVNLAEVEEVENLQDGDTLLVARGGDVFRISKDIAGGGVGGYLIKPSAGEVIENEIGYYITTPCDELIKVVKAGGTATIIIDTSIVGVDEGDMYINLVMAYSPQMFESVGAELFGAGMALGQTINFVFTNGAPAPASLSLETLNSRLGGKKNAIV